MDPWQDLINEWIIGHSDITVTDVMHQCLKLESNQMTKLAQMRVSDILRHMGLTRTRKTRMGKRCYVWIKDAQDEHINEGASNVF